MPLSLYGLERPVGLAQYNVEITLGREIVYDTFTYSLAEIYANNMKSLVTTCLNNYSNITVSSYYKFAKEQLEVDNVPNTFEKQLEENRLFFSGKLILDVYKDYVRLGVETIKHDFEKPSRFIKTSRILENVTVDHLIENYFLSSIDPTTYY